MVGSWVCPACGKINADGSYITQPRCPYCGSERARADVFNGVVLVDVYYALRKHSRAMKMTEICDEARRHASWGADVIHPCREPFCGFGSCRLMIVFWSSLYTLDSLGVARRTRIHGSRYWKASAVEHKVQLFSFRFNDLTWEEYPAAVGKVISDMGKYIGKDVRAILFSRDDRCYISWSVHGDPCPSHIFMVEDPSRYYEGRNKLNDLDSYWTGVYRVFVEITSIGGGSDADLSSYDRDSLKIPMSFSPFSYPARHRIDLTMGVVVGLHREMFRRFDWEIDKAGREDGKMLLAERKRTTTQPMVSNHRVPGLNVVEECRHDQLIANLEPSYAGGGEHLTVNCAECGKTIPRR